MARPTFAVQPQRSDGRGWVPCEPHQATSYAVIRTEKSTRSGRKFTSSRVIGRYGSKREAEGAADFQHKATEPLARHLVRKLGRRITKESV
jgi:hypothetical protein